MKKRREERKRKRRLEITGMVDLTYRMYIACIIDVFCKVCESITGELSCETWTRLSP